MFVSTFNKTHCIVSELCPPYRRRGSLCLRSIIFLWWQLSRICGWQILIPKCKDFQKCLFQCYFCFAGNVIKLHPKGEERESLSICALNVYCFCDGKEPGRELVENMANRHIGRTIRYIYQLYCRDTLSIESNQLTRQCRP